MELTCSKFFTYGIDLAPLGLERRDENETYFCTPKGARIIGWAGVDGIHFCRVRGFGEMVFAVSPMNPAPHYVHPVAQNFSDFLRLLLACGDSAALEQAWQWTREQFQAFLADAPRTEEQKTVLDRIARRTGLTPMEDPWQYLLDLQRAFDPGKLRYPEEYYDLELNPDAPRRPAPWKVYYDSNFWSRSASGRAGRELSVRKEFDWAGHHWIIPSVYLCARGLVVDFCMQAAPFAIRAFLEKWDLTPENEGGRDFTQEQSMQIDLENPLHLDFHAVPRVNGKELSPHSGCGISWIPGLSAGSSAGDEAEQVLTHYELNPESGWMIWRCAYPWATKRRPELRSLSLTLSQDRVPVPGPHFRVHRPGDTVSFSYGGAPHLLTVQEYEAQTMDWSRMPETGMEHPSHYVAMTYTVTPDLPDGVVSLADCDDGDRPRQAPSAPGQPTASSCAMVLGIISGADGPTAIVCSPRGQGRIRAACSSLRFEPVEEVEWRLVFHEKPFEDTAVTLIP